MTTPSGMSSSVATSPWVLGRATSVCAFESCSIAPAPRQAPQAVQRRSCSQQFASIGRDTSLVGFAVGVAVLGSFRHSAGRNTQRRSDSRLVARGFQERWYVKLRKTGGEARRAKTVERNLRKILVCVKQGGPDETVNVALARAIKTALKENVSRKSIDNNIKKFRDNQSDMFEVLVGGIGPGGIGVQVTCVTDSVKRTRDALKLVFRENNGEVGVEGCVDHLFKKSGVLRFEGMTEERAMEAALEADADVFDIIGDEEDGYVDVTTSPENMHEAVQAFERQGTEPSSFELAYLPVVEMELSDEHSYDLKRMLWKLDQEDDVQDVRHTGVFKEGGLDLLFPSTGQPFKYQRALSGKLH